ncbi:MAG: hypothetical protein QM490_00060 [Candidatus Gracilibacteria bacterium]
MKKNISISAEKKLIDDFTELAHEFGTNRTGLLSMMMTEVVKTREVSFKRNYLEIDFDDFSEEENESLMCKGEKAVSSIFNTLDSQLGK